MNHQITLEELGMIPKQPDLEHERDQEYEMAMSEHYAYQCGGCICDHCANSVECSDICDGEREFGCFDCDECKRYAGSGVDRWKMVCSRYKITNAYMQSYAEKRRRQFHVIKKGGRKRGNTEKNH